jgi:hypothetical protein
MPVSIHAHHALADGLQVAQLVERFQNLLNTPDASSGAGGDCGNDGNASVRG